MVACIVEDGTYELQHVHDAETAILITMRKLLNYIEDMPTGSEVVVQFADDVYCINFDTRLLQRGLDA